MWGGGGGGGGAGPAGPGPAPGGGGGGGGGRPGPSPRPAGGPAGQPAGPVVCVCVCSKLKYADKRSAAVAIIEGADERAAGTITIKNLKADAPTDTKDLQDRAAWLGARLSQVTVPRADLVKCVNETLGRKA